MTSPVEKALWYIESHLAAPLTLDDIARASDVSRYHLARAFASATGQSVMRYARGRRLSVAARCLAGGAPDILAVALDAGYGSHEAFTRAFREQWGVTPEALRAAGHRIDLQLVEPMTMTDASLPTLDAPRIDTAPAFVIAGLAERYTMGGTKNIPALWQRFMPYIGQIPGQIGDITYGVCTNPDAEGNFDYIAGVPVAPTAELPPELARLAISAHRYAVFLHKEHISGIHRTFSAIWSQGLPQAGLEAAEAPCFEKYDGRFDPGTGKGIVEIWVPVTM